MKALLTLLLIVSMLAVASETEQGFMERLAAMVEGSQEPAVEDAGIEVIELFRAENTDELEAAFADGYPPAWLEEVLSDTTIPEEDRYWLDCRVRAVIAQNLNLFFDRSGEPVHVEADWIKPSEGYWRETYVLSPLGDQSVFHPVESGGNLRGEIGQLVDRYGQDIGETALTAQAFQSSRDGSIWASSLCRVEGNYRLVLLYSNGVYFVSPIEMGYGRCGVSQSGEYVILAARGKSNLWNRDDIPPRAILLSKSGTIIWETELEMPPVGNIVPVISPDDSYCVVASHASNAEDRLNLLLQVFDMETGHEIWRLEEPTGTKVTFSPDGNTLFIPGNMHESYAVNISDGEMIWSDERISTDSFTYTYVQYLKGSNNADILSAVIRSPESRMAEWFLTLFDNQGQVLAVAHINSDMDVSPNGCFVIAGSYPPRTDYSDSSLSVSRIIKAGE